jgi:hypothetical protein
MTTQDENSYNYETRKATIIIIGLFLCYSIAFGQRNGSNCDSAVIKNMWWSSLLKKHNIDLDEFNFMNTFDMGMNDTINNLWLEMGISDSLSGKIKTFRNAVVISRDLNQTYWIMTSQYASHDFEKNQLILRNGEVASYDFNLKNAIPIDAGSFQEILVDMQMNSISYIDYKSMPNLKK